MTWIGLRHKGYEILFPEEWNAVVDALDILYAYWAHAEEMVRRAYDPSRLESDVAPAVDSRYDVGKPDRRWRDVYAMYGYFYMDLLVQGRRVIKDGDPVGISAFLDEAKQDIEDIRSKLGTIATNTGTTATNTGDIRSKLGEVSSKLDTISSKIDGVKQSVDTVATKLDTTNAKLSDVVASLGEVSSKQDLLASYARYLPEIYTELDRVETRTASIDAKLSDVVASLGEVEARLDVLNLYARYLPDVYARVSEIGTKLDTANARLEGIESKTSSIDTRLSDVVTALSEISSKQDLLALYARYVPDIYARLGSIEDKVGLALTELESIDSSTSSISTKLDTANTALTSIDGKMSDTLSALSEISSKEDLLALYARHIVDVYMKTDEISRKLGVASEKLDTISGDIREASAKLDTLASIDQKVGDIASQLDVVSGRLSKIETNTGLTNELLQDTNNFLSEISAKQNALLLYARYTQDIYVQLVESSRRLTSIDTKIDVGLSTRASEETLKKLAAYIYDFAVRRNAGRLLATIDFTICPAVFGITETQLGLIRVEGNARSVDIVGWSDEGIAQPEGTGSPNVMKIVVAAGGTVYVRVPIKARYWHAFSAYVTLYARDYDIYVLPYIVLGGILAGSRNRLPKRLRLPANRWGRLMVHWFMEAHHGCAEIVVEIYNPNSVDVTVYLGVVTAGEIEFNMKGFGLLFGWEDTFELELSNESLSFDIHIMIPTDIESVAHMMVSIGIAGDGSNPMSASITLHPGGVTLISASNTSTTPAIYDKRFKAWLNRRGVYDFQTMVFSVNLSTNGTGKVTRFVIVFFAITEEYRYSKAVSGTVAPGATSTVIDLINDVKHICGGELVVTAPSDGSVDVLADTPEGTIPIYTVPAGTTRTVRIEGRYTVLQLRNNSPSSSASYTGYVVISDAMLFR